MERDKRHGSNEEEVSSLSTIAFISKDEQFCRLRETTSRDEFD